MTETPESTQQQAGVAVAEKAEIVGEAIIVGGAPTVITDGWWGWCAAAPHMSRRMSPAIRRWGLR